MHIHPCQTHPVEDSPLQFQPIGRETETAKRGGFSGSRSEPHLRLHYIQVSCGSGCVSCIAMVGHGNYKMNECGYRPASQTFASWPIISTYARPPPPQSNDCIEIARNGLGLVTGKSRLLPLRPNRFNVGIPYL